MKSSLFLALTSWPEIGVTRLSHERVAPFVALDRVRFSPRIGRLALGYPVRRLEDRERDQTVLSPDFEFPKSSSMLCDLPPLCSQTEGFFLVRPAWAHSYGCKSRRRLVTVSEAKRNCTRATDCGKEAWIETAGRGGENAPRAGKLLPPIMLRQMGDRLPTSQD
jgi:hypothetical protein